MHVTPVQGPLRRVEPMPHPPKGEAVRSHGALGGDDHAVARLVPSAFPDPARAERDPVGHRRQPDPREEAHPEELWAPHVDHDLILALIGSRRHGSVSTHHASRGRRLPLIRLSVKLNRHGAPMIHALSGRGPIRSRGSRWSPVSARRLHVRRPVSVARGSRVGQPRPVNHLRPPKPLPFPLALRGGAQAAVPRGHVTRAQRPEAPARRGPRHSCRSRPGFPPCPPGSAP